MSTSPETQTLYLVKHRHSLTIKRYDVPEEIDREVALYKIAAMGLGLDVLTPEQDAYLNGQV